MISIPDYIRNPYRPFLVIKELKPMLNNIIRRIRQSIRKYKVISLIGSETKLVIGYKLLKDELDEFLTAYKWYAYILYYNR